MRKKSNSSDKGKEEDLKKKQVLEEKMKLEEETKKMMNTNKETAKKLELPEENITHSNTRFSRVANVNAVDNSIFEQSFVVS